jgi:hypothetical protein
MQNKYENNEWKELASLNSEAEHLFFWNPALFAQQH